MAYNVSEDYRTVVYSGEALYDCKLKINNVQVPNSQIQTIKISSPIIDTTSDSGSMFHIGTFISQSLEIKFKNLDGLTLTNNPNIDLEIGMYVNNAYEYVPIGKYLIDELAENYQKTCTITCMDYALKFKPEIDISKLFDHTSSNESGDTIKWMYAGDLFEAICGYYGVEVGTYPNVNNNKAIYFYDSTLSGKQYIMYLAELFGGNAKIERDGSCSIIPLKNYTNIQIDALSSRKFDVGNTYELTRVCFDNGVIKYQAGGNVITVDSLPATGITNTYYYLTTDMKYYTYTNGSWIETTSIKNTLYLKTDNMFITQQTDVTNIYNAVKNFSVTNLTCENRMDLSLDCWDIVTYTTGNNSYNTFYDNTSTFNGVVMGTVKVNLPLKTREETTNVITASESAQIRTMRTTLNEQENSITTVISEVDGQNQRINTLSASVEELQSEISNVTGMVMTKETYSGAVAFQDITNTSEVIALKVHPTTTSISYLYPRNDLYPSDTLYMPDRRIRFRNNTTNQNIYYELPSDLLFYDNSNYDEFSFDLNTEECIVVKRCKYNSDGTVGLLSSPTTTSYPLAHIELTEGVYTVYVNGYNSGYISCTLMAKNIYTDQFYTQVETKSLINQTATNINLSVDTKLSNYSTTTEMNSALDITNNAITAEVSRATTSEATLSSRISQTATGISLSVNNGNTSSGITITTTKEDGTTSQATGTIQMNGLVSFTNLSSSGQTQINGANITTGTIKGITIQSTNYSADEQGTRINLSTGVIDTRNFKVSSTGNITAKGGTIGGFTIDTNKIYKTKTSLSDSEHSGVYIGIDGISLGTGSTFKVTNAGVLTATSATISGEITSTSGKIGGFNIGSTKLYNGKSSLTANTSGVYIGTDGISLGTGSTFKVTSDGALTASNATITGEIRATSGNIGGATINNGVLTIKNANIESINGSKVTGSGTMSGNIISTGSMSGNRITNGTISGDKLSLDAEISCGKLGVSSTINCQSLSADEVYAVAQPGTYGGFYCNNQRGQSGDMWIITGWTEAGGGKITFKGRNVTFTGGIITYIGGETTATAWVV